jgi:hypothetical protein
MPMRLEGSCRCGAISFGVDSHTAVPVSALLLLDLPQERGRRRIRDQYNGPSRHSQSERQKRARGMERTDRRP